ncbi:MAG TPA: carboxypeptidase regulatory-like domain-containing protein [Bryobacteraceae bacterium]|nr:carboxypeptidase regulatory-like domain-containing protein [Bryobacteraceae bacterium]
MRKVSLPILLLVALVLGITAYAQNISGSLSGRLVDQQGGTVANATITAIEPSKNTTASTKTNAQGDFVFPALQPGNYSVSAESPGFKKTEKTGITLDANTKLALGDFVMQVGSVTESVEVAAQAATLQTESVDRSATITNRQMQNIEVNGRNPLDMAKLIPGVVATGNFQVGGAGGLGNVQANGSRGSSNQLTINGIGNVDTGSNGGQNVTISLDSMAEFKILTGTYQAEYGRNAGAQVSMVTKSGTDQFHGSGYFYHRHDQFNANTWINNAKDVPRNLYRYNDPGFTIGGPVFIPKILPHTRDKLFFFWSEEWQKQLVPNTPRNVLLPTALERQGNFSRSVDQNGRPLTIRDPYTQQPLPGNIVPANELYAPGLALLNLFPQPNVGGQVGYNYTSQVSGQQPRREDLVRLDYNVTQKLHVFGHYIYNAQPIVYPYGSFVLGINVPITPINYPNPGYSWATGATYIINPTMTNEFNMGVTHNSIDIVQQGTALTRTTSGINLPLLYPNAVQDDYIPGFNFTGSNISTNYSPIFTSVGDAPFHNYNTTIDISNNIAKISGSHTIKGGIYLQRSRKDQSSFGNNNGQYNFGDTSSNPFDTGYGFSNAATGVFQNFDQASSYIVGQYRYWNVEGFIQDTWKVTPRLTLDYGLRVAWYQPQYDSSLQASTFVPSLWDPAKAPRLYQPQMVSGKAAAVDPVTGQVLAASNIGFEVPNSGDPFNGVCQASNCANKYLQQNRGPQWGPRFGFAWDVTGKQSVVVRAGAGIYYDRYQGNRVFDMVRNPPEGLDPNILYGFAQNISSGANVLLAPLTLYAADPTGKLPTTYTYQFSVQNRLPWDMILDTAYVGSQGRHLQDNRNLNPVPYGATFLPQNQDPTKVASSPNALLGNNALSANFLRPMRGYGQINLYESAATANYNSLQISLNKRATTGLFFGLAYTWSKALTNATSDTAWVRADNLTNAADYGPANFDRRQILAINYVYSLPNWKSGNRILRAATNGWQLSGVTQASTGAPFTPTYSISNVGSSNITGNSLANGTSEGGRLGVVPGCNPYTGSDNPWNRLNPNCFTAPRPGSLGLESGLNWLYQPGLINFDMSVQKQFTVKERLNFQFRVDAFNVFNHPNFTSLNTQLNFTGSYPNGLSISNAPYNSAGQLVNQNGFGALAAATSNTTGNTFGAPRILQMMVRVTF